MADFYLVPWGTVYVIIQSSLKFHTGNGMIKKTPDCPTLFFEGQAPIQHFFFPRMNDRHCMITGLIL